MPRRTPRSLLLAASLLATSLVAVSLVAASSGPARAQNTPTRSTTDKDYLVQDAQGSAYELETAKLATQKASNPDVKAYAQKLVHDHETYNAALQRLGHQQGFALPTDLTAADTVRLTALKALSGSLFDKAYVKEAIRINADDLSEAKKEMDATQDDTIKTFLSQFAGMDAEHEALAKALDK